MCAESGRVDVLMHCAGLEISHFLPDKPQREYDLVFDVKADGWFNLLHALGEHAASASAASSSARSPGASATPARPTTPPPTTCCARASSNLRRHARGTRGIAIDWTAWAGIGMASRGSIPKMMEMAGIDMLPPEIGVPIVRRELTAAGAGGEVLVAGALGVLLEERHPTGGLDAERGDRSRGRRRRAR